MPGRSTLLVTAPPCPICSRGPTWPACSFRGSTTPSKNTLHPPAAWSSCGGRPGVSGANVTTRVLWFSLIFIINSRWIHNLPKKYRNNCFWPRKSEPFLFHRHRIEHRHLLPYDAILQLWRASHVRPRPQDLLPVWFQEVARWSDQLSLESAPQTRSGSKCGREVRHGSLVFLSTVHPFGWTQFLFYFYFFNFFLDLLANLWNCS